MKTSQLSLAISLAISTGFVSTTAFAENQTSTADIEVMTVTGNRTLAQSFDVLAGINTFERQDIELIQPVNVTALLNRIAGVSVSNNGGHGQTSSVFVRGANSDHVLVLVDGIRVGSATTGNKALSDIPVDMIERIEVVRGPRAALWGADALAGVIQIFTREQQSGDGNIELSVGSNDYRGASVTAGLGNQAHNLTVALSTEAESGYDVSSSESTSTDNDGFEKNSLILKGSNQLSQAFTLKSLLSVEKGFAEYDDGITNSQNNLLALSGVYTTGSTSSEIKVATSKDDSTSISPWGINRYITSRDQANLLSHLNFSQNTQLTAGLDYFQDEVSGTNAYTESQRETYGGFIAAKTQLDAIKAEVALRRDSVESVSTENTYNWSLGYQLNQDWLVAFTQGTGFKAPSFNELYSPLGPYSIGNIDLMFETSLNRELLTKYRSQALNVELNIFETQFDNLIEYVYGGYDGTIATWQNVEQATTKGVELALDYIWGDYSINQVLSYTSAKNEQTDTDLIRRPRLKSFTSLNYSGGLLDYSLEASVRGNTTDYGGGYVPTISLFNASVAYQVNNQFRVTGRIENLLDKDYYTVNNYRASGRFAQVSVNYSF